LKQARKKAGVTQEKMARMINTHKGNISRIENHARDIKLSTLEKFAAVLGKKLVAALK
jgi:transcriptional regulator with XRE-family HTH domain